MGNNGKKYYEANFNREYILNRFDSIFNNTIKRDKK